MKPIQPSPRYAEYVKAVLSCGHWEPTGRMISKSHPEIIHVKSGQTLTYQIHDGGSDQNSPRNFAASAQRICGCKFVQSRGRKRSRKKVEGSGFSMPSSGQTPAWVDKAWHKYDALVAQLQDLQARGDRSAIQEAVEVAREIASTERALRGAYQPPPDGGWLIELEVDA